MQPGIYSCARPKLPYLLTISSSSPSSLSAKLYLKLLPGEHGNEEEEVEHVTFNGEVRIDRKVVTFEWKSCDIRVEGEEDKDKEEDDEKSANTNTNTKRIKVSRVAGMITPEEDGVLFTGALPFETQGLSHGGYLFKRKDVDAGNV